MIHDGGLEIGGLRISKKLAMALVGVAVLVGNEHLGLNLTQEGLLAVLGVVATYIGGQSVVDMQKAKAANGALGAHPDKPDATATASSGNFTPAPGYVVEAIRITELLLNPATRAAGKARLEAYDETYKDFPSAVRTLISDPARAFAA